MERILSQQEFNNLNEEVKNLKEVRSQLEAILHSTDDAISVVDEKGIGILINPAYTRITGLTEADVIGRSCTVDIAEGESMHMQVLKSRQPVRGVQMKVGTKKKPVVVNVAPIIMNGELKGSVGIIHDISEIRNLTMELEHVKSIIRRMTAKYTFDDIIGESELVRASIAQAMHAAGTPATVLLRGESGTGKELFAHAIHNASQRSVGPFVRVNCAAIAESLIESELFGYEEGAFTGAVRGGKKGYFEEADGGTIFLDEIGDVPPGVQVKLLRVLQEKEVTKVGGTKPVAVNVRVIAATNANLELRVKEGLFREDLYYRVNVFPIFIPPLRGRREDIPELALHFTKKLGQDFGRRVARIAPEVFDILAAHDWPGNVRELENVIGRTIINMDFNNEIILPDFVPPLSNWSRSKLGNGELTQELGSDISNKSLSEILDSTEKQVLIRILEQTRGNKTKAAQKLGIATRSLYYKLEKYGLK